MAQYTCETEIEGDVFIVRSIGYLDEKGGQVISKAIEEAIEKGFLKYVLNFAKSPVINSPGIARLLEFAEIIVEEKKGRITFVGLNELTMGVFRMVGLLHSGPAFPDEAAALKSL